VSLTSTLLFGEPITLPKGRKRRHSMFRGDPDHPPAPQQQAAERLANIERIYSAIAAGSRTREEVIDATGLSNGTVWKATLALESWPTGPRIAIEKNKGKHTLRIAP